ncbi:unnamed protein product [Urochloa decumbens]|uniref:Serine hydrolase domain-containing protein n=1 Tax=Urochloa decumbens TaxID=240449 RepID=A0ABC9D6J7_9POAL
MIRTPPRKSLRPRQLASPAAAPPASAPRAMLPCHLPLPLPAYAAAPSPQPRRGLRLRRNAGAAALQLGVGTGEGEPAAPRRLPRLLCLHGFRTSAEIMRRQVVGRWPAEVTSRLDLVFADGPFPAEGASPVAGVFDPPYYEWFQFAGKISGPQDPVDCRNLDGCFSYLEELMIRLGPFDGLLGFSQGAAVSAVLAGLQEQVNRVVAFGDSWGRSECLMCAMSVACHGCYGGSLILQTRFCVFRQGLAFTGVAKVKCVIAISGGKIHAPVAAARAYDSKIVCPSLHFIGDDDFAKPRSEELLEAFADPLVIRHPCAHTVPNLDEKGLQTMITYLDKVEGEIWEHSSTDAKIMASNLEAEIPGA